MAKKKGEMKLIMPKHTASVDHLKYALKVCIAHPGGVDVDTFKGELFAELHAVGIEATKNSDGSHYTKCLQLPRYFGLVRYCLSGERANAITKRGLDVYTALTASPVDSETLHRCFFESIVHNQFGQGNEGVGSESFCEPMAIFFRAVEELDGIENQEYGYLIQEMDAKGRPYGHIIQEIRASRTSGAMLQIQAHAQNISDWKTILFLVNIGFLAKRPNGRVVLSSSLPVSYSMRLMRMPLYGRGFKKQLFMRWMESKNLGQSVLNYADSLEAVTEDGPVKDSARFCGFYECLTGRKAGKKIYDVVGLEDYKKTFSALELFWSKAKDDPPYPFEEDRYYECYYYAKGAKRIDNARLENACQQYKQFLSFYDTHKEEFSVEEETMYTGKLGSIQKIVYGAPGTGKSFGTDGELVDANGNEKAVSFRTTFHPDSDYSTFVGTYKPTMNGSTIEYGFRPQAFMCAYVKAWRELAGLEDNPKKPVALVVEEINRGNCAQVFGDLFQLLDRDDATGYSTYPITTDKDLAAWLKGADQFGANGLGGIAKPDCIKQGDWDDVLKGDKLVLPPNLYIWATMNTSDQSLFPIDSAFKRRWDWKYVPIAKPDKEGDDDWRDRAVQADGKYYDWWKFISILNHYIRETTKSEDKQLGYFFVKAPDATGIITADQFVNKVLFYLFGDVFKDWELPAEVFEKDAGTHAKYAFKDFFHDGSEPGHKVGEVKEDEVVKFIKHLKWDGKDVAESAEAPKTNGEKASASATAAAGVASSTSAASAGQS